MGRSQPWFRQYKGLEGGDREVLSLDYIMVFSDGNSHVLTQVLTKLSGNFVVGVLKICFLRNKMRVVFEKVVF